MPARLIESLATTEPLAELFSDRSVLQALLDFEAGLARVQARLGIIPAKAAKAIIAAAKPEGFDIGELSHGMLRGGTAGIPLSKALTEKVARVDKQAAAFVHWGATSQDVADTALILLLKRAKPILIKDVLEIEAALLKLSEKHKGTVMLGRTLMQAATPITFGLKAAGWLGAIRRNREHLEAAFEQALVVQFGGATGTCAALGHKGAQVMRALAKELGLGSPDAPWHTHRDRLAALVCACGILTGSLGKMARDISLLMQNEVAEAAEPGGDGRGGSSTMPHKRNPIGCAVTLAAAHRVPGEVASFLSAMVQEHERGVGGWQMEWPVVATVIQSTGLAAASMSEVARGLTVDKKRMSANIENTRGMIFAERASMLLKERLGRQEAHALMEEASKKSAAEKKTLSEVLAEIPEVTSAIERSIVRKIDVPKEYLGSAEEFRKALTAGNKARTKRKKFSR